MIVLLGYLSNRGAMDQLFLRESFRIICSKVSNDTN
jgi:hypothetical protein